MSNKLLDYLSARKISCKNKLQVGPSGYRIKTFYVFIRAAVKNDRKKIPVLRKIFDFKLNLELIVNDAIESQKMGSCLMSSF